MIHDAWKDFEDIVKTQQTQYMKMWSDREC